MLETSDEPVDAIASRIGLAPAGFRRHFRTEMGIPPSAYRRQYRSSAGSERSA
jgi:transcriptional regulator GlxA family with amidase domain